MPLVNPAPIVYQTLSNEIDRRNTKQSKDVFSKEAKSGLLTRKDKKEQNAADKMTEVDRVMHYMKLIRLQREELNKND
tara:strand:- start:748 stop:981 length:234 start_codon:yes stop_codon:yes gene_type:complete